MPDEDTLLTQTDTNAVSDDQQAEESPPTEEAQETEAPTSEEGSDADANQEESDEESQEAGAPDAYESFEVPDGYGVDETVLSDYQEWAKQNELTQEQAQEGINLVAKMKEAEVTRWVDQQKAWVEQAKGDSEFGGDKFDQSIAAAVKARDAFGTPEFNEILNESGLGNHPEMIRYLTRVGQAISEDQHVVVGGADSGQRSRERVLYPSMNQ